MIIDLHCHYTLSREPRRAGARFSFEPATEAQQPDAWQGALPVGALPTDFDSCVSPRALGRLSWRLARVFSGLPKPGPLLDEALRRKYAEHLLAPGPVDRAVVLAFDAVHDEGGRCLPLPRKRGEMGSDIYTSNTFVRALCQAHPERFLFGASVHPYRPDALAAIDEVFAGGACVLKWIPLHHNIDIADARTVAVLEKCAELGLPLLLHYNEEFSLTTNAPRFRPVAPLLDVLRRLRRAERMPIVILAHVSTPVTPLGDRESHKQVLEALSSEFRDAPLYADISALTAWTKVGFLRGVLRRRDLHGKLLFGSDFPVPVLLNRVRDLLGSDYAAIAAIPSWPQRAQAAFQRMGFEEHVFRRAATLLPHTDFFAPMETVGA